MDELNTIVKTIIKNYLNKETTAELSCNLLIELLHKSKTISSPNQISSYENEIFILNIFHHLSFIIQNEDNNNPVYKILLPKFLKKTKNIFKNEFIINNISFANNTLPHLNLSYICFKNVNFTESILSEIRFEKCRFIECNFLNTNITNAKFNFCKIIKCNFTGADMNNQNCTKSNFIACTFYKTNLANSIFKKILFSGCIFDNNYQQQTDNLLLKQNNMSNTKWLNCTLDTCSFRGSLLHGATFRHTKQIATTFDDSSKVCVS